QIESGQAMIFYTDGIVEARNDKGQELGYDGLFNLLADCYHIDAAEYYENIMRTWRSWLGTARPGDDLTMIVLVRR
ncbi:MAG TPA: SpoIIE family protein phosphatase, partial [Candidatus Rifleibacterium sp.]|nr:SpoIIE family protein phosphatase [Candidatus Rifleibacterium sp.]